MIDTSKRSVEGLLAGSLFTANISDVVRALVAERDAMSNALSFIASKGEDVGIEQVERIAREAMTKR